MNNYNLDSNKEMWNEWATLHAGSEFYDVEDFKNEKCSLYPVEVEEIGDVNGKSLLHLMCHFGKDTLSWARRGAKVTGVDFSDNAIDIARSLAGELKLDAEFICCNLYDLPQNLDRQFDIVYTSAGVLCWLPDLDEWGCVIAQFLKSGGFFYILEGHPFLNMLLDEDPNAVEPEILRSYFYTPEPEIYQSESSYTGQQTSKIHTGKEWTHSIGDIVNSLISAGLRIEFLHEFPYIFFNAMPYMKQDNQGSWRIPGDKIPLIFTLKAMKP
ncbi:MAG: class I SAM-dependent methyltransferase [Dehalococcoidales bacterium]|nr:MAG: class I SAM-dependent methyltransferase [Dehalococcoidales bacterium]